jgi:hypothetical protein
VHDYDRVAGVEEGPHERGRLAGDRAAALHDDGLHVR